MKIYVVSLQGITERRVNMSKQLDAFGVDWTFFDAVDLRNISEIPSKLYDPNLSLKKDMRLLTRGEVGCAVSHLQLWKTLNEQGAPFATILEDDAYLRPEFRHFIQNAEENTLWGYDVIILGYPKLSQESENQFYWWEPIKKTHQFRNISIGRVWREWTSGCVGYILSKRAIQAISSQEKISTVSDDWKWISEYFNLKIGHIRPLLVLEDFHNYESSLEQERMQQIENRRRWLDSIRYLRGILRRVAFLFAK